MAITQKKSTSKKAVTAKKITKVIAERKIPKLLKPFVMFGGYFKGAWFELRQVRWPNRRATWSLTGAVLLFTGFFVVLILLLDILFKYLFGLILG
jgi:preprotein translocase SecE subunit